MYLLRLSLRPWRRAPWSQVFSALAMGFLLCVGGILAWFEAGLAPLVERMNGEQVITAYLAPEVSLKEEAQVADAIRVSLGAQARSADIRLVGQDDFLQQVKKDYPELAGELENLGGEMTVLVPRYVSVAGTFPAVAGGSESVIRKIRQIPGVESAESSQDRFGHIATAFSALRWVARVLMAGLALAILTGLVHLARINSSIYQDALRVLRLWGANALTLRVPAMTSGLSVGLLGGILAASCWLVLARWVSEQIRTLSPLFTELPQPGLPVAAALLGMGALFGALTSLFIRTGDVGS